MQYFVLVSLGGNGWALATEIAAVERADDESATVVLKSGHTIKTTVSVPDMNTHWRKALEGLSRLGVPS
jgi:hypothetical protein